MEWDDFHDLLKAFAQTSQSKGGFAALEGFSFQFLVSLLALVRAHEEGRHSEVFLETLSDLVERKDGGFLVTQVKRTLSSGAVSSALLDLWTIDRLAAATCPALQPKLQYQILGNRQGLADIDRKIIEWAPKEAFDPVALAAFKSRLRPWVESDPLIDLAIRLAEDFAEPDPFRRIDAWMGMLLANPNPSGFAQACTRIGGALVALEVQQREREHLFSTWTPADAPPAEVKRKEDPKQAVLTGQLPKRHHLQEGYFCQRSSYREIVERAELWLGQQMGSNGDLLGLFWIGGPWGCGKSVALLHLLAASYAENPARVIVWLGDRGDRIAEAVRWARPFLKRGEQVILAGDDPFTTVKETEVVRAFDDAEHEIAAIKRAYPDASVPAFIFCGPSDQVDAFEDRLADRLSVTEYRLHRLGPADLEELRAWYAQRSGKSDLAVYDDDALIVQLFFEWSTGEPLAAFAGRLKRHLAAESAQGNGPLLHLISRILAMNRIYAYYPKGAVDHEFTGKPAFEKSFNRLRDRDDHFTLNPGVDGYRMTHPHLANAIYSAWYKPGSDGPYIRGHLQKGIEDAARFGRSYSQRNAPLWSLSRLGSPRFRDDVEVARRISLIEKELRAVLPDVYAEILRTMDSALTALPVWCSLNSNFGLRLHPDPSRELAHAVADANGDEAGLALSCHSLLKQVGHDEMVREAVSSLLNRYRLWRYWPSVALHFTRRFGLEAIAESLSAFVARCPEAASKFVYYRLCSGTDTDDPLGRKLCLQYFRADTERHRFHPGFLTDFMDRWGIDDAIFEIATAFLEQCPDHSSWPFIWEQLFAFRVDRQPELCDIARAWLEGNIFHPGWSYIWQLLAEDNPHDLGLQALGKIWWREAETGNLSRQYVWKPLWNSEIGSSELIELGLAWLRDAPPEHPGWKYVWRKIAEADPNTPGPLEVGKAWLVKAQFDYGSWRNIWLATHALAPEDQELHGLGIRWICAAALNYPAWSGVLADALGYQARKSRASNRGA
ncbi:MAG: hypothetical protein WDN24_05015 [Sphingomonas sp.]